jgi:hypothetical protein
MQLGMTRGIKNQGKYFDRIMNQIGGAGMTLTSKQ